MIDGDNGEVYAKFFEMIRDRYRKRKQKRSVKRVEHNTTIPYEVLEAYILLLNRQNRLLNALGKYKEKLQFGTFAVGKNVILLEESSLVGDFSCILFCG